MKTLARASAPALGEKRLRWTELCGQKAPGNIWSRRMESNVENALVKLFPVSRDLLHTCLALKVPQPESCQYRKETKVR